jgi:hypothetical protein
VKLATDEWEVNVRASAGDFLKLAEIRSANWNQRGTVRAGESAGAPVFWTNEGDQATLLIGHDDETWDVAITVPVVDEIVREPVSALIPERSLSRTASSSPSESTSDPARSAAPRDESSRNTRARDDDLLRQGPVEPTDACGGLLDASAGVDAGSDLACEV